MPKRPENDQRQTPPEITPEKSGPRVFIPLRLDRRSFVRGGSAALASTAMGGTLADHAVLGQTDAEDPVVHTDAGQYATVMDRPDEIPSEQHLQTLTPHEAHTVDAITSRIMPGSPDDPGAYEAGVVIYIDNLLAFNQGYAEFTYLQGPWAQTSAAVDASSSTPTASPMVLGTPPATPEASLQGSPATEHSYDVVMIDPEEIQRYGYQSRLSPRDVYRIGLAALDRYAMKQYERLFKDLHTKQQDEIVGKMAEGKIDSFDPELTAQSFFQNLRRHTAEGMFSDPAYGGNRNMVGWKLVGYPGAQRAYMPAEFMVEGTDRQPQSMDELNHFNPGQNHQDNDNVILPVSGSDREEKDADHP